MKTTLCSAAAIAALCHLAPCSSTAQQPPAWYAGVWDASPTPWTSGYWGGEDWPLHPTTLGLRIEVTDSESGTPLGGAEVRLEGDWTDAKTALQQTTRLIAVTGADGVAVFGLTWLGKGITVQGRIELAKDDIEKVQRIWVRKPGYTQKRGELDYSQLAAKPRLWTSLVTQTEGARYFILQTGEDYRHGPERSTSPFFFQKVRDEDYYKSFTPASFGGKLEIPSFHERLTIGPFIVLPLKFGLAPAAEAVVVRTPAGGGSRPVLAPKDTQVEDAAEVRRMVKRVEPGRPATPDDGDTNPVPAPSPTKRPLAKAAPAIRGLVAHFRFDGNAADATGNGHSGRNFGASPTTDRHGAVNSALELNGNGNVVHIPRMVSENFTVSFWVRTTQTGANFNQFFGGIGLVVNEKPGRQGDWGISILRSKVAFGIGDDPNAFSESDINTGEWVHVTGVRDAARGKLRIYINGRREDEIDARRGELSDQNVISVGRVNADPGEAKPFFEGSLDDLMFFDRALSDQEVRSLVERP